MMTKKLIGELNMRRKTVPDTENKNKKAEES